MCANPDRTSMSRLHVGHTTILLLAISTISLVDNCYIYIVLDIHQIVYTFHPST